MKLYEWAVSGRSGHVPQDALQALDVVLKEAINLDLNIGRSYFPLDGETLDVGFGKEVWIGSVSSVRPYRWKAHEILITLNVDIANKPATRNLHLTNESPPGKADSYTHSVLAGDERRKAASKEIIPNLKISVADYFKNKHEVELKYPNIPCLWVGPKQKTIYIPMEFCHMDKQPMPRNLPDDAIAKMVRATADKPMDRMKSKKLKTSIMTRGAMVLALSSARPPRDQNRRRQL